MILEIRTVSFSVSYTIIFFYITGPVATGWEKDFIYITI